MKRTIVHIDEEKCDGCGLCIPSCHEGAIRLIDGKARVISDAACDGLGACLGDCPQGAITLIEREAPAFDAVLAERLAAERDADKVHAAAHNHVVHAPAMETGCGCPGARARILTPPKPVRLAATGSAAVSALGHWPVQLALISPSAAFLKGANLLVCADCVPFALPDFHSRHLAGKVVLVGCPKLDDIEACRAKLARIFAEARPASLTVMRMEVPCCGGLAQAAEAAWKAVLPEREMKIIVVGIEGQVS